MNKVDDDIRRAFRTASDRFSRPYFGDVDRDGVPNIIDCRPKNPYQQGLIHDWLSERKLKKALKQETAEQREYENLPPAESDDEPRIDTQLFPADDTEKAREIFSNINPEFKRLLPEPLRNLSDEDEETQRALIEEYYFKKNPKRKRKPYRAPVKKQTKPKTTSKPNFIPVNEPQQRKMSPEEREEAMEQLDMAINEMKQAPKPDIISPEDWERAKNKTSDDYNEEPEIEESTLDDNIMEQANEALEREQESSTSRQPSGRPLGGREGKIYLYIKTDPTTYSLHEQTFDSRIEASQFADEYFKGNKYKTLSESELAEMTGKQQEKPEQAGPLLPKIPKKPTSQPSASSSDILKSLLENSYRKAQSEGLTATQLSSGVGGLGRSFDSGTILQRPSVSQYQHSYEEEPRHETPGVLQRQWRPQPYRPQQSQWRGTVGKKAPSMRINAPFASYSGPRFSQTPNYPAGNPTNVRRPRMNTSFYLYRPPTYGSRGGNKINTTFHLYKPHIYGSYKPRPVQDNAKQETITKTKSEGGKTMARKKKTTKRKKKK